MQTRIGAIRICRGWILVSSSHVPFKIPQTIFSSLAFQKSGIRSGDSTLQKTRAKRDTREKIGTPIFSFYLLFSTYHMYIVEKFRFKWDILLNSCGFLRKPEI